MEMSYTQKKYRTRFLTRKHASIRKKKSHFAQRNLAKNHTHVPLATASALHLYPKVLHTFLGGSLFTKGGGS